MTGFRVGLMDPVMAARPTADGVSRANYVAAVANRVDSYWVPDHINGQTPRPLWDPEHTAAAAPSSRRMPRWKHGRIVLPFNTVVRRLKKL